MSNHRSRVHPLPPPGLHCYTPKMLETLLTSSLIAWSILLTVFVPHLSAQTPRLRPNPTPLHSTTGQSASTSNELDKLYATATKYTTSLSKIECKETIHSEQNSTGFSRPVHWKLDTRSDFTALKSASGVAGFKDQHTYKEKDGKPIAPVTKMEIPYMLTDAFAPALISYLGPERRSCLHFSISKDRVNFETVPGKGGHGLCADIAPEAKGYAIFDRATETISHFERTVPLASSLAGGFAPFAAVDYEPYGFGGELIMLPRHIVATKSTGTLNESFDGTYESCLLFKSKVKMFGPDGKEIKGSEDQ